MRGAAVLALVGRARRRAGRRSSPGPGSGRRGRRLGAGESVNICHAAGNGKFVSNSPDADSIVSGEGHGGHPEDIIPPFEYEPKGDESGHYPGQNWNARWAGDLGQRLRRPEPARPAQPAGLQSPRTSRRRTRAAADRSQLPAGRQRLLPGRRTSLPVPRRNVQPCRTTQSGAVVDERRVLDGLGRHRRLRLGRRERVRGRSRAIASRRAPANAATGTTSSTEPKVHRRRR